MVTSLSVRRVRDYKWLLKTHYLYSVGVGPIPLLTLYSILSKWCACVSAMVLVSVCGYMSRKIEYVIYGDGYMINVAYTHTHAHRFSYRLP